MDPVKLDKKTDNKQNDENFNFETVFSSQANPIPKPPKQKKKTAPKKGMDTQQLILSFKKLIELFYFLEDDTSFGYTNLEFDAANTEGDTDNLVNQN